MGSLDAGSVVGFQLRLTTAGLGVALASQAEAQFYAHYRSLPSSLENATDAEDVNLIVRGHVSRTRNDLYPVKVAGGAVAGQLPATFVTMAVVEVLKDHDLFKPGQSLEIRHSGFTADARASEEVTKDWDPQWPRMEVGREYVLFVFINQSGKLWLYSPQGCSASATDGCCRRFAQPWATRGRENPGRRSSRRFDVTAGNGRGDGQAPPLTDCRSDRSRSRDN